MISINISVDINKIVVKIFVIFVRIREIIMFHRIFNFFHLLTHIFKHGVFQLISSRRIE